MEQLRSYLAMLQDKGPEWQIKVAWKILAVIGLLSFAAHAAHQQPFDRKGLAQLAAKETGTAAKPRVRKPDPSREPSRERYVDAVTKR